MKFSKNWKRFFTLDRHHAAGFTLVELIVVIAILAILAGIAVPAYSGYIDKAERAADEQLLAAINTAYASACLENGTDMALLKYEDGANMPLDGDKGNKVVKLSGVAPYGEAFARYYAGNEASAFKVFDSIVYSPSLGMFCDLATAPDMLVGGYKVTGEALNAFQNGALGELGAEELLGLVTDLTEKLGADAEEGGFGKDALSAALASEAYQTAALKLLGIDMGYDEYMQAKYDAAYEQYKQENGFVEGGDPRVNAQILEDAKKEATKQRDAMEKNMLILVGASKAEEASGNILDILKGDNAYKTISSNVKGEGDDDSAMGTAQSALAYSLYASYCQRNKKEVKSNEFLSALSDPDPNSGFKTYLSTNEAKTDLDGAKAAMGMIGNQSSDILENTAVNGLGNQELEDALTQILGK